MRQPPSTESPSLAVIPSTGGNLGEGQGPLTERAYPTIIIDMIDMIITIEGPARRTVNC